MVKYVKNVFQYFFYFSTPPWPRLKTQVKIIHKLQKRIKLRNQFMTLHIHIGVISEYYSILSLSDITQDI